MEDNVESLIRKYVTFRHGVAGGGWNVVYCEVCGDGSRTKGPRAGWLFSDGGNTCFYHCFNCGCKESFSVEREHPFSKGMRDVFDSFLIPNKEYNFLAFSNKNANKIIKTKNDQSYSNIVLPDCFTELKLCDKSILSSVKNFLWKNYRLSITDYTFYYCQYNKTNDFSKFSNRLIIPYYKSGKIIYYNSRDITGTSNKKYLTCIGQKSNIFFNIDELFRYTIDPLYITEGEFDSIHVNGVATLGNELTSQQIELLKQSKRRKILIPDFKGDSNKLLNQFIDNKWEISFPEYRHSFKDISEAIVNYGKLYVVKDIVTNIKNYNEAKIIQFLIKNKY